MSKKEYDPTDPADIGNAREAREQNEKLSRDTEEADIKWLMKNRQGRRIMWRQLDRSGVFRTSFSTNALQMAFNEGTRNEGLIMVQLLNRACPDLYQIMVEEALNDRSNIDGKRPKQN